jgi:hypothetical protein
MKSDEKNLGRQPGTYQYVLGHWRICPPPCRRWRLGKIRGRGSPRITASELAALLHITERAVKKNIAKLKAAGRLNRIGPDKGGHWEVLQ